MIAMANQCVRWGLDDFLPKDYVEALPRTVSSIVWGGDHHLSADGRVLFLSVVVPAENQEVWGDAKHVALPFDLAKGKALAPDPQAWSCALASARKVSARLHKEQAVAEAAFIAPLAAPRSNKALAWRRYLIDAFFRLDPDWKKHFPDTEVLELPLQKDYQDSVKYLKSALHAELNRSGVVMIASPSQDNLVRVLREELATVPRGSLRNARIYVAVDNKHTSVVAHALVHTGATYIQLDPRKPIPQRRARLDAFHARHQ